MLKLGTIAFGGPAVHVAMLRDEAVRRRGWIDEQEFLDLFGALSVLPGPSSTQLAMVLSRRRAGWLGLALGGTAFIAPAMVIVTGLAWAYARYGSSPSGGGVLYGVGAIVVAVVVVALCELARSALKRPWFALIGVGAVIAYFAGVNVLIPLAAGGLAVALVDRRGGVVGAHAWLLFLPVLPAPLGVRVKPEAITVLAEFAKLGVIVFGSGYVLLAFLRADLVTNLHWLTERQVLDAVAAGQVTPGPVFTTATFVGYLLGGVPMALLATAGIFLPSFLLVTALDGLVTRVRRSRWLAPALDGVTVAALGLMAGVTVDLGRTAISDPLTVILATVALVVLLRWRPNPLWLVVPAAIVGIAHSTL